MTPGIHSVLKPPIFKTVKSAKVKFLCIKSFIKLAIYDYLL